LAKSKKKKKRLFKGTEAHCILFYYYKQKGTWLDKEICEHWFHKNFIPEVSAFLKENGLPQKGGTGWGG
jgi:hypothetical protein